MPDTATPLRSYLRQLLERWLKETPKPNTATPLETPKPIGFCAKWTRHMAMFSLLLFVASVLVASVGGIAVVIVKFLELAWESLPNSKTDGQIIVDSPKVYTRERLVNDRLEEASWLGEQLKVTADQLFKPQFQSVAGRLSTLERKKLSIAGNAAPGGIPAPKAAASESESERGSTAAQEQPALPAELTIDRFRDLHTFREEVRAEMMQTQLDDRHDIGGNTIYRLTFDTTIVAGPNTHKLAWIEVDIRRDAKRTGEEKENKEIFDDWRKQVAKDTRRLLASNHAAFVENGLSPDEQREVLSYFIKKLCPDRKDKCLTNIATFTDWYTQKLQFRSKEFFKNTIEQNVDALGVNSFVTIILQNIDELYLQYRAYCFSKSSDWSGFSDQSFTPAFFRRPGPARPPTSTPARHNMGQSLGTKARISQPPAATNMLTDGNRLESGISCAPLKEEVYVVTESYYRLFAIVDLYDRVRKSGKLLSEMELRDVTHACGSRSIESANKECPPLVPTRDPDIVRCAIAHYTEQNLKARSDQFEQYFTVEIDGEEANACDIQIKPRFDGAPIETPEQNLADELASNVTTFSYAVTPRNMMQRLGIISGDDDVLSVIGRTNLDEKFAVQAIEMLQERSRRLELAQGFPIVVGRGSNQTSSPGPESSAVARFGWVIAPAVRNGTDRASSQYLQITQQYTLAAVISVPSWWRRAQVAYKSCWFDPRELKFTAGDDLRVCMEAEKPLGAVNLPGRVDEISRKLGFWVINTPNLDDDGKGWILAAGKKQSIVIRGSRLWRSTAVTLGSQKADRIEVLPNMNGIIATFNCLQEQMVPIPTMQVWTSEGVTPPAVVQVMNPPNPFSSCSEDGTPKGIATVSAEKPDLDEGQQWNLTAGRMQAVVIRGTRLYGAVVTLGSQKADKIEVLPNANGIIATFECLQEQQGPTMLQVWTSEGVTRPVSVAVSHSNDGQYCSEDGKPKTSIATGKPAQRASGRAATPKSSVKRTTATSSADAAR